MGHEGAAVGQDEAAEQRTKSPTLPGSGIVPDHGRGEGDEGVARSHCRSHHRPSLCCGVCAERAAT